MPVIPYTLTTATGDKIEFAFPLHPDTASAIRVSQLLTTVLGAIDRDIKVLGETSNGDVLQALAMALSARAAMIHAAPRQVSGLVLDLAAQALAAGEKAERIAPIASGRA